MPIKHTDFIIKGMHRDLSESAFNPEFAYENQNLRITADKNNSSEHSGDMYALTNEKGNKYTSIYGLDKTGHNKIGSYGDIKGTPIGQCMLNNQWVIYTTEVNEINIEGEEKWIEDFPIQETTINDIKWSTLDRIYRLWRNDKVLYGELLYEGHLNFDYQMPIETVGMYENENIQKVYWTDGLNQPRFINIVETEEKKAKWDDNSFDFVSKMDLTAKVTVTPKDTGGMFPAGKIQWYFTYTREFGQETNIFASTDLYDIKYPNRGASPEEVTSQSFEINLTDLEENFDFVNIYSVIRTSLNNVPNCKLVATLPITKKTLTYIDTNLNGEIVEPQSLFYKGGEEITAYTFENKDNTLFLGNYTLKRSYIPQDIRDILKKYALNTSNVNVLERGLKEDNSGKFRFSNGLDLLGTEYADWLPVGKIEEETGIIGRQTNTDLLNTFLNQKSYFRKGNIYRIGIQFQHYSGKWSEAIWLGDYKCTIGLQNGGKIYGEKGSFGYLKLDNTLNYIINKIVDLGYLKVRPLVVLPNITERPVVCQGVLSTTLISNTNFNKRYPDYFFRTANSYSTDHWSNLNKEIFEEVCFHNKGEVGNETFNSDNSYLGENTNPSDTDLRIWEMEDLKTIYSPDIEFDDTFKVYNYTNIKIQKAGYILGYGNNLSYGYSGYELQLSTPRKGLLGYYINDSIDIKDNEYRAIGFRQPDGDILGSRYKNMRQPGGKYPHFIGGYIFEDGVARPYKVKNELLSEDVPTFTFTQFNSPIPNIADGKTNQKEYIGFRHTLYPVYLWQNTGSIIWDNNDNGEAKSVLKSKKIINVFCGITTFEEEENVSYISEDTKIWKGNLIGLDYYGYKVMYDGNVNIPLYKESFYPHVAVWENTNEWERITNKLNAIDFKALPWCDFTESDFRDNTHWGFKMENNCDDEHKKGTYLEESISLSGDIRFSTIPHLVTCNGSVELRDTYNDNKYLNFHGINYFNDSTIKFANFKHLPLVNVIQDVQTDTIFGGYTDAVLQNNDFLICGDSVTIADSYIDSNNIKKYKAKDLIEIIWSKGDTYIQDYACLKTYPMTLEDENCLTEILDFEVETYYNIEGRYDQNIKNPSFATLPSNWNLMNPVYNQKDNFMVYHGLDLSKNSVNNFPNSFTWTLTKWAGESVDKWTQITLANTMDVDGDKGGVTKLIKFQDNLLCFQPKGLSQILYNEREQIATGSGVPIEIANSGKVSGIRYVTERTGCNNKWSICKTESGLYWVDDENKAIMAWNQQLANLSDTLGFHSWINAKSTLLRWNPIDFNSFVTYYDPYNESIMFFYKENMLSYNTQLNCFDSFFSYGHVPYYMAFDETAFTLSNKDCVTIGDYKVWEQQAGNYNYFFVHDNCEYDDNGNLLLRGRLDNENNPTDFGYEPYFTTILVNPDMPYDKIFNNIDTRTDMWDKTGKLLEETFSHLEVWNEFQWNKSQLVRNVDIPKVHLPAQHSILKKKFRVWYMNIPRDIKQSNPRLRYYNRDRMRNTWLYVKLSKELIQDDPLITYPYISDNKHIIHHIGVSYFV